jgi:hypothetical protein
MGVATLEYTLVGWLIFFITLKRTFTPLSTEKPSRSAINHLSNLSLVILLVGTLSSNLSCARLPLQQGLWSHVRLTALSICTAEAPLSDGGILPEAITSADGRRIWVGKPDHHLQNLISLRRNTSARLRLVLVARRN